MLMRVWGRQIIIHPFGSTVRSRYARALQAKVGTKQKARIGTVRPRPSRLAKARIAYQERASSEDEKPGPEMTNGTPVFISQPGPLPRNTLADKYALTTLTKALKHLSCWGCQPDLIMSVLSCSHLQRLPSAVTCLPPRRAATVR